MDLVANGTSTQAIRLVDIRKPSRPEFAAPSGYASGVEHVTADVTSEAALVEAFTAPWPSSVAQLPLTVFHTAAVIRPYERHEALYERSSRVNVVGTAVSINAARKAQASVFIYTSSSTVPCGRVNWLSPFWLREPRNFFSRFDDSDFWRPLRAPSELANNYTRTKAEAERLVCGADTPRMRTAVLRPGAAIYGRSDDILVSPLLKRGTSPFLSTMWVQNLVHVRNVSNGHLFLESALVLSPDKVAARPFIVTDDGPPLRMMDMCTVMETLTPFRASHPPPLLFLALGYLQEAYCIARAKFLPSSLARLVPDTREPICYIQPGLFDVSISQVVDNSEATKDVENGGIGYRAACGSLEGLCAQMKEWNDELKLHRS